MKINSRLNKFNILNRKKEDPENFIYTGKAGLDAIDIQCFKYNADECIEKKELAIADIEAFDDDKYTYWLNIYSLSDPASIAAICRKFNIHNLVIQDILDLNQRPKFQEFDDFSFLTIKTTVPSSEEFTTEQISFILGKNYIISFQERRSDHFGHLRTRLRSKKGLLRERSSDFLLYTLLESILDNYFKTLEQLENEVDSQGFMNSKEELSPVVLEMIENSKKTALFIKKAIIPIKEFTVSVERDECKLISKRSKNYFYELKDLCLTLLDTCDTIFASLESSANLFFYIQGHRMNQVMKLLTIISTIFIPLTFIAGVYGMNFHNMPEIGWKYGYMAVWILMLVVLAIMIYFIKKHKWF